MSSNCGFCTWRINVCATVAGYATIQKTRHREAAMEQSSGTRTDMGTHACPKSSCILYTFPLARAGVALGPMPNVAALLKDRVLVLKVIGCAVTTEVGPSLPVGTAVTVLARDMPLLDGGGEGEEVVEAENVTTVTTGVGGGGGGKEVVAGVTVVLETVDRGDSVG